ncbi:hypothetical protein OOU_Y34scaffold00033g3 [Pyricularia oryzae Y34]|nr:hypothetical protein OOU_Y34scaffold00033g3 [Pyricularia oryzae Y34]
MSSNKQRVQCFGKKKTATAVAQCVKGQGLIKVNGRPLNLVEPATLRYKASTDICLNFGFAPVPPPAGNLENGCPEDRFRNRPRKYAGGL